jgi:hypothetical protein
MKKKNDPFEGVFDGLQDKTLPTDEQKEKMLKYVLLESRLQDNSTMGKVGRMITIYPWRFSFGAAAVQALVFTLIFGTEYTNLFLSIFGG